MKQKASAANDALESIRHARVDMSDSFTHDVSPVFGLRFIAEFLLCRW